MGRFLKKISKLKFGLRFSDWCPNLSLDEMSHFFPEIKITLFIIKKPKKLKI
jgi:hypothetical protein